MNYWLDALLIVDVAHGIEYRIEISGSRTKEPDPVDDIGTEKGKTDIKWIFTTLCKFTKVNYVNNTIMRIKKCEAYNTIIEYIYKYRTEGKAVTLQLVQFCICV